MDNYTITLGKKEIQGNFVKLHKGYELICTCCGKKFWTENPLQEVCSNCVDEFADIVSDSYSMEFEKED